MSSAQELEGGGDEPSTSHSPRWPPEAQGQGGGQHGSQDGDGLHPDEHRHQQAPGPGQEGFHPLAPETGLLLEAQAVQGAQDKEGGFDGGKEGAEQHQHAQGEIAEMDWGLTRRIPSESVVSGQLA